MGNLFFFCAQASPADVFYRSRNLVEEIDSQTTDTGSATDDTIPRACALQGEGGRERERGWEREREHPLTPPLTTQNTRYRELRGYVLIFPRPSCRKKNTVK